MTSSLRNLQEEVLHCQENQGLCLGMPATQPTNITEIPEIDNHKQLVVLFI